MSRGQSKKPQKPPEVARTVAGGRVRSTRPPDRRTRPDFPTAAAVAEGIHAAWYLIRDPCRGRGKTSALIPGGLSLRERPPATVRVASGDGVPLIWTTDVAQTLLSVLARLGTAEKIKVCRTFLHTPLSSYVETTECRSAARDRRSAARRMTFWNQRGSLVKRP